MSFATLLRVVRMVASNVEPDPVKAGVDGHIEHVRLFADAEFDIAWQAHLFLRAFLVRRTRGDEPEFFTLGTYDHYPRAFRATGRRAKKLIPVEIENSG